MQSECSSARPLGRVDAVSLIVKFILVTNACTSTNNSSAVSVMVQALAGVAFMYMYLHHLPYYSPFVNELHAAFAAAFCWIAFCVAAGKWSLVDLLVRCPRVTLSSCTVNALR